jgi:TIR domain
VPSAFVSYAHEDQELVLALVEHLGAQGLDVRYDQVVLRIGDSLIERISDAISEGDFLIAVVSPDSVESEWCKRELALAMTDGINERRVKVLPVRFRGSEMPPMLRDTYWADADEDDVETIAERLAVAMQDHLEGRDAEAARDAREVQGTGGQPAHAEIVGDVGVALIDRVAERLLDLLAAWAGIWRGGNVADIEEAQRRLRWDLSQLPDRYRAALPLVEEVAAARWEDYFQGTELADAERDLMDEVRSVRTKVAQGLPVRPRWRIVADLGPMSAGRRDAVSHLWEIRRGDEMRRIQVYISGTAMAASNEHLPPEVARAKETNGQSVVTSLLGLDEPPEEPSVTTAGISHTLPD